MVPAGHLYLALQQTQLTCSVSVSMSVCSSSCGFRYLIFSERALFCFRNFTGPFLQRGKAHTLLGRGAALIFPLVFPEDKFRLVQVSLGKAVI